MSRNLEKLGSASAAAARRVLARRADGLGLVPKSGLRHVKGRVITMISPITFGSPDGEPHSLLAKTCKFHGACSYIPIPSTRRFAVHGFLCYEQY
jgi:hypothetical protein